MEKKFCKFWFLLGAALYLSVCAVLCAGDPDGGAVRYDLPCDAPLSVDSGTGEERSLLPIRQDQNFRSLSSRGVHRYRPLKSSEAAENSSFYSHITALSILWKYGESEPFFQEYSVKLFPIRAGPFQSAVI